MFTASYLFAQSGPVESARTYQTIGMVATGLAVALLLAGVLWVSFRERGEPESVR